jgi:hypothetical protein
MTVTTTKLTRAAGLAAMAGGAIFIAVQIGHPNLSADLVTTTEWTVRQSAKIVMAVLSLIGITGMYLRQTRQVGVLGLLGYLLFGAGYLIILSFEAIGLFVLPLLAPTSPGYVTDVLAVAVPGGQAVGEIGLVLPLSVAAGITFLGGGLVFGIALLRAGILARWAAALLAVGSLAPVGVVLLPQVNYRLFAIPTAVALVGLGYSLWREQRSPAVQPVAGSSTLSPALDPAGAR